MRIAVRPALVILLLAGAAGCGGSGAAATNPSIPPGSVTSYDLSAPEEVARGLDVPWGLAFLPGGDALIGERGTGRILRLTPGGEPREIRVVQGVEASGEGGLLGLAVSPGNLVYAYLTTAEDNRIVRFDLSGGEQELVFGGIARSSFHNGGRIAFGPDGMLYAGTGDAGDTASSQDPASPNGKILRLDPDGKPPRDNPISGSPVYSLGHRNVQGLAWDAGNNLWATEFGQNDVDEINEIRPGRNYGWPEVEGEGDTAGGKFTNPAVTWQTREASPSGMAIAGGDMYVAALRGERLWTVPFGNTGPGSPRAELVGTYGRLRTVQVAPDGALWLTTSNTDGRGDVRDGDDRILRFPAR
ncbi:PQQ-dependent sugar dehydrogenase [Actinoplanes sp. NPDC023801]|uniref:PQQ-dependent sugar dehydrogenase n=1 Tax=Actinoplanes sp. NPDC023801 TaxID=3154595 RepID=UPI0033D1089A